MAPILRVQIAFAIPRRAAAIISIAAAASLLDGCGGGGGGGNSPAPAPGPVASSYAVGGTVSGLAPGSSLTLALNGGSTLQRNADGAFSFPSPLLQGSAYTVSVDTQPSGQTCSVSNGNGTVSGTVANVLVSCAATAPQGTTLTVGGSISGMSADAQIGLLNNGAGLITLNANAPFSFLTTSGSHYSVSVARNPPGQLCAVSNADGVATAAVSNVTITCRAAQLSIITGSAGGAGRSDGVGTNARFDRPSGNAVDAAGNVYVADWNNHIIRKITPGGVVSTFAGTPGVLGAIDGPGEAARFCHPLGIAIDTAGFLYVTETCNEAIRKVSPGGEVSTFAGAMDKPGFADGTGGDARFNMLSGIAIDTAGTLYVADIGNNVVRKVSPAGRVTTLAGKPGTDGFADGTGSAATFSGPNGIAVDASGNVFVTDSFNQTVRKITPDGTVSTLAGTVRTRGYADGPAQAASFSFATREADDFGLSPLGGIVVDKTGTIFLSDYYNHVIRTISTSGQVATAVGLYKGYVDAQGMSARLRSPTGISIDASGNLYVSEDYNSTVRKISPSLATATLAGKPLISDFRDGGKDQALFWTPLAVAADAAGNIYVADFNNGVVRKISPSGVTTTLAGTPGEGGVVDGGGAAARFYNPSGVAVDSAGNVYVSDARVHNIRKITPGGVVSTFAGSTDYSSGLVDGIGTAARFNVPMGLAVDRADNVYVADSFNTAVRKISPGGAVTTLAGGNITCDYADSVGRSARFCALTGIAVDSSGNVFAADVGNDSIRKITPDGTVTTLAGHVGPPYDTTGSSDGVGTAARFLNPEGIALDAAGNIYVADSGNCTIRMVTPAGVVSTIAGVVGRCEVHEAPLPALVGVPVGLAIGPGGRLIISSNNGILGITGLAGDNK